MSTETRTIDAKAFMAILNSRKTLKKDHVGQQVLLSAQGKGTFVPKGKEFESGKINQFDKTIYNLKANSQLSMLRAENKALLSEALKAESTGDAEGATTLFNKYLNAVQVSFNVIEPSSRSFQSGDMVTAVVAIATSDAGAEQIVVNDVRYKAPTAVEATKFEIADLITA